ncbi:MAG: NADH-quinone oxidoreductase subunit L [Planctomycetes bacterium]|nr:NADH-quinone oxidoreductase subunit L [Planctomycetota bacterium]
MEGVTHYPIEAQLHWIVLAPLLGFALIGLAGARLGRGAVSLLGPAAPGVAFVYALDALQALRGAPEATVLAEPLWSWLDLGALSVSVGLRVDALAATLALVVTGVGFLIHVYSVGYMGHEPDGSYARYFAFLNLFTFAMLVLVLADNLVVFFVGWEGVGLCSYLLIGFWYRDLANSDAGRKAFVVNRVGDLAFVLGMFVAWRAFGTLDFARLNQEAHDDGGLATLCTLLFFIGATGKSAQLPLHVWLPDAMAGPTPVSALIHAATMVTAGVYMIGRLGGLYAVAPATLAVVAWVGCLTALYAGWVALAQRDIKKVLAWSTISQLGTMFVAMGVGAYASGLFHLVTHAFFKATLFLGAGAVIHGLAGEQDLGRMGGLARRMPVTALCTLLGALALAGVPPLSGFFSKDAILFAVGVSSVPGRSALCLLAWSAAALTGLYVARMMTLAFLGAPRSAAAAHAHEPRGTMAFALLVLAALAAAGGALGLPEAVAHGADRLGAFLAPGWAGAGHGPAAGAGGHAGLLEAERALMLRSGLLGVSVLAVGVLACTAWGGALEALFEADPGLAALRRAALGRFYVDEVYGAAVVRPLVAGSRLLWRVVDVGLVDAVVNGLARLVGLAAVALRPLQGGLLRGYAALLAAATVLLVVWAARGWFR